MTVHRLPDADAVAATVAEALLSRMREVQADGSEASVVLTGGSISRAVHRTLAGHARRDEVDWGRVHWWWGDERFVTPDDPERNAGQAEEDLLAHLPVDRRLVHAVPARGEVADAEAAAAAYAEELTAVHAGRDGEQPWFDVLLLGIGPDGHCASLFPGRPEVRAPGVALAVHDSPKPPPTRVSLTMATLGRATQVWFVAAGDEKAQAVADSVAGADVLAVPAAGPRGRAATHWFVDEAAAALLSR